MNGCDHQHKCTRCGRAYSCNLPECRTLEWWGDCERCGGTVRVPKEERAPEARL